MGVVVDNLSNSPPFWEYHQSIIVRHGDRVYVTIMETLEAGFSSFQKQWTLYERTEDGWQKRYSSLPNQRLNQPPLLLADRQNTLHVFAWPEGVLTHFMFDMTEGLFNPAVGSPEPGFTEFWPWLGGSINASGDILTVIVTAGDPRLHYLFREATTQAWTPGTVLTFPDRLESPTGFDRHTFPFVIMNGREVHIFSAQDIEDPVKIAEGASYTFSSRRLDYYYSPDILKEPFQTVPVANIENTRGWLHNDDMLLDRSGTIHILYWIQRIQSDFDTNLAQMHAFGPPGGPLTHVEIGRPGQFTEGRLWEAPDSTLYVVLPRWEDLYLAPLDKDGGLAKPAEALGIAPGLWGTLFAGQRIFLAPARASVGGAPVLEGLYRTPLEPGKIEVRYFRVDFPNLTMTSLVGDFDNNGKVDFADFLGFASHFGRMRGASNFDSGFDLNNDGQVNFPDFLSFASHFGQSK
ncbi:MAG: hypothetical protein O7G87_15410 [bacterium]|nr:hypothetical protein [bacterium]